jgi:heterodisulfide reductase subunit D
MNHNITQILNTNASKVITSCSGCYRTLKKDWVKFGAEYGFEVFHTTEIIHKLLNEGKLKFKSEYNKIVTYHDPCHLGRHMDFYEIPRQIIEKIPGINLVEMERNKGNAWCCGAGGGVKIGFPDWSVEVSKERLEEAKNTGAKVVTSACPFCRTNLSDANEKYNMGFEIYDLIEIIDNLDYEVTKATD